MTKAQYGRHLTIISTQGMLLCLGGMTNDFHSIFGGRMWSAAEEARVIRFYRENLRNGRLAHGSLERLCELLPHRTRGTIQVRLWRLKKRGLL